MSQRTQEQFAAALIDDEKPVPDGTAAWNGMRPARRFGVYRNNVAAGLVAALASRFPAAMNLVGADFFSAMAHVFIRAHPPRSPVLLSYGDDFPSFVDRFDPAAGVPYLGDVCRLEVARGHAYHAADATPLNPARLASVEAETVGSLRFKAHPSAAIMRPRYPVITIWAMNTTGGEPRPLENWDGEDALVVRPAMMVEVHRLSPGEAVFLSCLFHGNPLLQAVTEAAAEASAFALDTSLARALRHGVFTDVY